MAAGQEDQPISDSGVRPGYSAFTGALLDILETELDLDNDGILTASEIGLNLGKIVASQQSLYQTPVYSHIAGTKLGDFIFKLFAEPTEEEISIAKDFQSAKSARESVESVIESPSIVDTSPGNGDSEVPISSLVTASFSKRMNTSTINTNTFIVRKDGATTNIPSYNKIHLSSTLVHARVVSHQLQKFMQQSHL